MHATLFNHLNFHSNHLHSCRCVRAQAPDTYWHHIYPFFDVVNVLLILPGFSHCAGSLVAPNDLLSPTNFPWCLRMIWRVRWEQQRRVPPACLMKSIHNLRICVCFFFLSQSLHHFMWEFLVMHRCTAWFPLHLFCLDWGPHECDLFEGGLRCMLHASNAHSFSIFICSASLALPSSLSWCHPAAHLDGSQQMVMRSHSFRRISYNIFKIYWAWALARKWSW